MRPIVDVQYGDFLFLGGDLIINNAEKKCYMPGGKCKVPLVMRAPVGATDRGSQHARNMERYFLGGPGLKVIAPSNVYDAKGILKSAVRDDNSGMIFEHKLLYGSKGRVPKPEPWMQRATFRSTTTPVPLDKAAVRREGRDVTVLSWLLMAHLSLVGAEQLSTLGINAEVVDLRSLMSIDYETIERSLKKTGRVGIIEEGPKKGGVSPENRTGNPGAF